MSLSFYNKWNKLQPSILLGDWTYEFIIKERLNKQAAIGFMSDLSDKYDNDKNIIKNVTGDDLRSH